MHSKKSILFYWVNVISCSVLYQITLRTWQLNLVTSSLETGVFFLCVCVIGFRVFDTYKLNIVRSIVIILISSCSFAIMFITAVITQLFFFMNGWGEYPQPITDGITIIYAVVFAVITLKISTWSQKLKWPRGKCLLICFIPFIAFIVIGILLTLICKDDFMFTSDTSLMVYDYNTHFSFVFVDITIGLSIYEMLKYNKGKQQGGM